MLLLEAPLCRGARPFPHLLVVGFQAEQLLLQGLDSHLQVSLAQRQRIQDLLQGIGVCIHKLPQGHLGFVPVKAGRERRQERASARAAMQDILLHFLWLCCLVCSNEGFVLLGSEIR